jgi:Sec7-like guanine-nucleotide exchange factor
LVENEESLATALVANPFNTQKYRDEQPEIKDGWKKIRVCMDTGASHMLTRDASMLTNQRKSNTTISTAAEGSSISAKAKGTVHMQFDNQARSPFMTTTDAIYSPNCGAETLVPPRQVCHSGDIVGIIYSNMIDWHRKQNVRITSKPLGTAGWMDSATCISKMSG